MLLHTQFGNLKCVSFFFFVDTSPQFGNEELTSPEDRNISLQLTFSALDKHRLPANVSFVIGEGW